jgi:hypothetical protein
MNDNEKFLNDNSMEAIDKKINEMGSDNLDGLESSLNHMDSDELRSEAKEMIDDCSKNELKKVLKLLIKISRKSFEDE